MKILALLNENNVWIDNENELQSMITNFYSDLYKSSMTQRTIVTTICFSSIMDIHKSTLEIAFTLEETKSTLFSMGNYKLPVQWLPSDFLHKLNVNVWSIYLEND